MYDTIIIGAGVVGLATGMYAGRLNMKTLVLGSTSSTELPIGGVITTTEIVENYPGFIKLTGQELAKKMEGHAREYDIEIKEERAIEAKKDEQANCFTIKTDKEETYQTKTLIFATGAKWRELPMKGAEEYKNKGVHYCALCDGAMFQGKTVAIVGGSDTAAKEALLLANYAEKVYIIYRGEKIRPEPVNTKLVETNNKIEVINNTNITEIHGEMMVNKVTLDKEYNGSNELELQGVFGAIGHIPLSDVAEQLGVELNQKKEIKINRDSKTNIEGVFAAGDVVDSGFKQAITGVGEGVVASHSAYVYAKENPVTCHDDAYDDKK